MPVSLIECCGIDRTPAELLEHLEHDYARKCPWTYELAAAMLHSMVQHPSNRDGTRISTTVLTQKCLRQLVWERQTGYTTSLERLWPMFRGTQFHGQLEAHAHPASYAEARFFVSDLGVQLPQVKRDLPRKDRSFSGSPDLVDPLRGVLYDYKRTREVPRFNYQWADHTAQLNINRWLVDRADYVEIAKPPASLSVNADGQCAGVYPDSEGMYAFSLSDPEVRAAFVPNEWQEMVIVYVDDNGPKPIVATESIRVPTQSGGTRAARVPEVWDDARTEAFIAEKYVTARHALLAGFAPIPKGWEHQSHALCVRCPMRLPCATAEAEGK